MKKKNKIAAVVITVLALVAVIIAVILAVRGCNGNTDEPGGKNPVVDTEDPGKEDDKEDDKEDNKEDTTEPATDYVWDITVEFPKAADGTKAADDGKTVTFTNPGLDGWDTAYINQKFSFTREKNTAQMHAFDAADWIVDNTQAWYQWGFDDGGTGYGFTCEIVKHLEANDFETHGELTITLLTKSQLQELPAEYEYIWDITVEFPADADQNTAVTFTNPGLDGWTSRYRNQSFRFTPGNNTAQMPANDPSDWIVDNSAAWLQWTFDDGGTGYHYMIKVTKSLTAKKTAIHGQLLITLSKDVIVDTDKEYTYDIEVIFPEDGKDHTVTFTSPKEDGWGSRYSEQSFTFTRQSNTAEMLFMNPDPTLVNNEYPWYQWTYDDGGSGYVYQIEVTVKLTDGDYAAGGKLVITLLEPDYTWNITVKFPTPEAGATDDGVTLAFTNLGNEDWAQRYIGQRLEFTRKRTTAQLHVPDPSEAFVGEAYWTYDDANTDYKATYTVVKRPGGEAGNDYAAYGELTITLEKSTVIEPTDDYIWDVKVVFPPVVNGSADYDKTVKFTNPGNKDWGEAYVNQTISFTRMKTAAQLHAPNPSDWIVDDTQNWYQWVYDDGGTGYLATYEIVKKLTDGDHNAHGELRITLTRPESGATPVDYTWDITVVFPELMEGETDPGYVLTFTAFPYSADQGFPDPYNNQSLKFTRENHTGQVHVPASKGDNNIMHNNGWGAWTLADTGGSGYVVESYIVPDGKGVTGDLSVHGEVVITLTDPAEIWDIQVKFPELPEGETDPGDRITLINRGYDDWSSSNGWLSRFTNQSLTFTREDTMAPIKIPAGADWVLYQKYWWNYEDGGSGYVSGAGGSGNYEVEKYETPAASGAVGKVTITLTKP